MILHIRWIYVEHLWGGTPWSQIKSPFRGSAGLKDLITGTQLEHTRMLRKMNEQPKALRNLLAKPRFSDIYVVCIDLSTRVMGMSLLMLLYSSSHSLHRFCLPFTCLIHVLFSVFVVQSLVP